MVTKKMPKNADNFHCEYCDFTTSKQSNWKIHLTTRKHQKAIDGNKKMPLFVCDICDKELANRASLCRHKKNCKGILKNELREPTMSLTPDMIVTLLTQNQEIMMSNKEFKELIVEQQQTMIDQQQENQKLQSQLIEAVKEGKTINNNCNNTNSNNKFNLNFFLNEQCKNAMSIADFVNNMVLTVDDLKKTGELGYVDGITKIFTDKLKAIDTYDRPMHCTDLKRETLYIKQNNEWDKDTDKEKMKKAIECVANKNLNNLGTWKEENPGHEVMDSKEDKEFVQIMTNSLGGMGTDREKNKQKIIKNVLKEVMVEK